MCKDTYDRRLGKGVFQKPWKHEKYEKKTMRIQGTVVSGRKRNECPPCANNKTCWKTAKINI